MPPWPYAYGKIMEQAIKVANSLDDDKIADVMRKTTFKTGVGAVKFGKGRRMGKRAGC